MSNDVFALGERQAFIQGQELGRDNAARLVQTLVASIVQKAEKDGDVSKFKAASEIADVLFNYNWGLNGEKPPMPARDGDAT
jgi:hypothetical protein